MAALVRPKHPPNLIHSIGQPQNKRGLERVEITLSRTGSAVTLNSFKQESRKKARSSRLSRPNMRLCSQKILARTVADDPMTNNKQ